MVFNGMGVGHLNRTTLTLPDATRLLGENREWTNAATAVNAVLNTSNESVPTQATYVSASSLNLKD